MEKNNGNNDPFEEIDNQDIVDFITEINGEYLGMMDEEEEYSAYLSEYINKNVPDIIDILEAYPELVPSDLDLDNLTNDLIDYFCNDDEDFEPSYPMSKKEVYFDNVMSILKARDFLDDEYNDNEQNIIYARETLSDLISNTAYNSKEKLDWLEITEYITNFNPMNLGPALFDQELDYLMDLHARLSEDYYIMHGFLEDLRGSTANFITERYGNRDLALDIAEEIIDLIRPLEDTLRVYVAIKNNPKEFKTLRYKFFDNLNELDLGIYALADEYIPQDELSLLIMKVGDEYIKFLKELSEIDVEDSASNDDSSQE
jgi:hypothetical protein